MNGGGTIPPVTVVKAVSNEDFILLLLVYFLQNDYRNTNFSQQMWVDHMNFHSHDRFWMSYKLRVLPATVTQFVLEQCFSTLTVHQNHLESFKSNDL